MNNKLILLNLLLIINVVISWTLLACPTGTVKVAVYNTSPNMLLLETQDEFNCRLYDVIKLRPGIQGKYCIKHKYFIKITTMSLKGDTRLAVTVSDLWNDLVIKTPLHKIPDIDFKHLKRELTPQKNVTDTKRGLKSSYKIKNRIRKVE